MNKVALIIIIFIAILSISYFYKSLNNKATPVIESQAIDTKINNSVNYRASFLIYTNGTLRIFTDPKYHNKSAKAFINSNSPNQITVRESGITWRDFFRTLPMKLEESCLITGTGQAFCNNREYSLQFYVNGIKNQKVLDEAINDKDKLLVTYEPENSSRIKKQIDSIPDF